MQKMQSQPLAENRTLAFLLASKRQDTKDHIITMFEIAPDATFDFLSQRLVGKAAKIARCWCTSCEESSTSPSNHHPIAYGISRNPSVICIKDCVGEAFVIGRVVRSSNYGLYLTGEQSNGIREHAINLLTEADMSIFDELC